MRHSDPKLTAVIYTRTTTEQRAAAVGSIPAVVPAIPENETEKALEKGCTKPEKGRGAEWTQNNEVASPAPQPEIAAGEGESDQYRLKLVDTQVDTNLTDLDGKTRNRTESESLRKAAGAEGMSNEKGPENGAFLHFAHTSGPENYWGEKWDSNPRPSEPQTYKADSLNILAFFLLRATSLFLRC